MTRIKLLGAVALLVVMVATAGRGRGAGTWTRTAPLLSSRTEVTGAELGGRLYVVGGFGQGGDQVEAYDPRADRWERRAPLPVPIHHTAAVAIAGRLDVVGGYAEGQWAVLASVFEYDPGTDRWRTRAPLPTARGALAAAVIDGRLYAAGGVGATGRNTDALEVYEPGKDRWEPRAPMPVPRDHHAAAAGGGKSRRELCAEPRRPSRLRSGDQPLDGRAAPPHRAEWHCGCGPRTTLVRVQRRSADRDLRPGRGLRHRAQPLERARADADAAPRPDGHRVRGADPRPLRRPPPGRVVQRGPRSPEPLSSMRHLGASWALAPAVVT
jgi:Kelch motif